MTTLQQITSKIIEYVDTKEGGTTEVTEQNITQALGYTPADEQDIPTKISDLTNDANYITGISSADVTTALGYTPANSSELASAYVYKGSKDTYASLPTSGNNAGDVWNVVQANGNNPAGTNYAWTGSGWDALGGSVDLSTYATKSTTLSGYGITDAYTKTEIDNKGFLTEHQSLSGYVPTSRTINSKSLSANISLTASDVSALPTAGGIMTGTITTPREAMNLYSDTDEMVFYGSTNNNTKGPCIALRGISRSSDNGTFYIRAGDGTSNTIFLGTPSGTLKWGSSHIARGSAGSATKGVYVDSSGNVTAMTYELNKTVPSDAVFTDTNNAVAQNVSTANATYPILLGNTADATANIGNKAALFGSGIKANPSTSTITATSFVGALTGNATTATTAGEFTAAKSVTLQGAVTGTASSKGGWTLTTIQRSCLVGQSGNSGTNPWYKFATFTLDTANDDAMITFHVEDTYTNNGNYHGILRAHVRCNSSKVFNTSPSSSLEWLENTGYPFDDFVMVCANTAGATVELWTKIDESYKFRRFTVISEGTRTVTKQRWTLLNASSAGQSDSYTSTNNTIVSTNPKEKQELVLDISDTTPSNYTPRNIPLKVRTQSTSGNFVYESYPIWEIPTNQTANYGIGVGFGNGGLTVITGGECGRAIVSSNQITGGTEKIVLGSDNDIDFYTNGNTIANAIKTTLGGGTIEIADKPVINWLNANKTLYISMDGAGTGDGSSTANAMSLNNMRWYLQTLQMGGGTSDFNGSYTLTLAFAPLSSDATYGNISFDQNKMPGVQNIIITTSASAPASGSYSGKAPRFTSFGVAGSGLILTIRNIWVNNEICVQRGASVTCDTYLNIGRFRCTNYGRLTIGNGTYDIHRYNTDYLFTADTGSRMYLSTSTMSFNFLEQCNYSASIWRSDTNSCVDFRYDRMKWTGTVPAVIIASSGTLTATSSTAADTADKVATLQSGQTFTLATNAIAYVTFTTENTASNPTLNINSTGAKAIYYNGSAVTPGMLRANFQYSMKYDGTNYVINNTIKRCETITSFARAYRGGNMSTTYNSGSWNFSGWGTNIGSNVDNNGVIGNRVQTVATNPSSSTTYSVPFCGTSASGSSQMYINDGFRMIGLNGTTSAVGYSYLQLGNSTNSGTANNKRGFLRIYSDKNGYTDVKYVDGATTNITHILPATAGTLINTGTIGSYAITKSGDRGTLSGYETVGSATTINDSSADANSVNANVTVSNGTSNKAWTKIVYFQSVKTVTLGSNWNWAGGTAPTIVAGGILVCTWCGAKGIASFLSPS